MMEHYSRKIEVSTTGVEPVAVKELVDFLRAKGFFYRERRVYLK